MKVPKSEKSSAILESTPERNQCNQRCLHSVESELRSGVRQKTVTLGE